jgi:hypothetical protein
MTDGRSDIGQIGSFIIKVACCLALVATFCCLAELPVLAEETSQVSVPSKSEAAMSAQAPADETLPQSKLTSEERERLEIIGTAAEKAESRTKFIKDLFTDLIAYVRLMVVALIVIAIGFPVIIWLLSRRRILGLSGLSTEVAATLLVVEERQAKLANILKEIQGEIDYLHTMSVPDLKNLIQQAENYLKQNEQDLADTGSRKKQP